MLSDRELVERHYRHGPDTVRAHIRAVNWIYGVVDPDEFTNCPAHHIIHDGRRPFISPYEDQTNTDVEFTLEYDQSKSLKWNYYAEKWIAFWDDAYVSYWSAQKGDVVTATHANGERYFKKCAYRYYHCGDVPDAYADQFGCATEPRPITEWIWDTGASAHMLSRRNAGGYKRDTSQPEMRFAGVGGTTSSDGKAIIKRLGSTYGLPPQTLGV